MILDQFNLERKNRNSNWVRGIGQKYALALAEAGADIISVS